MATFDSRTVAQRWAAQTTDSRNNNGSLYFHGPRIFSYGAHHLIGLLLDLRDYDPHGGTQKFVLINADRASVTTSKQTSWVGGAAAIRHGAENVFTVPGLTQADQEVIWLPGLTPRENMARLRKVYPAVADALETNLAKRISRNESLQTA